MLCRTLLTDDRAVAVEMPCYNGALGLLTALGAQILPIPMDEKGMDPAALADTLARRRVRFIYCTPSYQNPTGRIMDLLPPPGNSSGGRPAPHAGDRGWVHRGYATAARAIHSPEGAGRTRPGHLQWAAFPRCSFRGCGWAGCWPPRG